MTGVSLHVSDHRGACRMHVVPEGDEGVGGDAHCMDDVSQRSMLETHITLLTNVNPTHSMK